MHELHNVSEIIKYYIITSIFMYLITGAAGFIGFHLSLHLLQKQKSVIGIDSINNYYNKKIKFDRLKILKKLKITNG